MKKILESVYICECHYCPSEVVTHDCGSMSQFEEQLKNKGWGMILGENACPKCMKMRRDRGLPLFRARVQNMRMQREATANAEST
jgi:hypothetical protein